MHLEQEQWTSIIKPSNGWFDIDFKGLWHYRDLIAMMVKRDFVAFYKQTILGPLWFLLQPLLTTIVFTIVFGQIAKLPTNGLPQVLFYLSGTVMWNYFAACLNTTSNTFVANAGIFGKVYFPRLVIPIGVVITNMLSFGIQFALFLALLIFFMLQGAAVAPNLWILVTPLLVLQMGCLGLGCGIIVSSMTTKYRDLSLLVTFGAQLWMYATPVVYPVSMASGFMSWVLVLNPMTAIIEIFRYAFLGGQMIPLWYWLVSGAITVILFMVGIILFSKVEKNFMDTV
ncbi:ABC transporter permease [Sporomusa sphaeroides]|uniref:Transport permease protein n=1 Tax=Sporomusa sphaeroides DSM 2875 TaxID=1337886 RepID=A0ABM9W6U4_9FIRM|nr:ABC transporter permease [Sporomusa sphaeroides]OLS55525.1 teichoic acid translocation permease protein TagG [Sporomusa sphaeroides DSM 2875]CVK19938.1 Teichoic acid translocation permease protein TagG [Sporomusa sphaeroides DSM 2875]